MKHWMFNCSEVSRMVSQSLDSSLPFFQRVGIRLHLLMCRYCSRFRRQLLLLRKTIQVYTLTGEEADAAGTLSSEAKERMKRTLAPDPTAPE
ncbi:zf-HC2 domain-containing protein [Thermodesulfobacteriota bacterium]